MYSKKVILITALIATLTACGIGGYERPNATIMEVPFTQIELTDSFWLPRIETNRKVSIPCALHECEVNGRFDNFAIAGGLKKGEHRGDFSFDDTDPYKVIEGASYSLAVKYDKNLDSYLDSVIAIIASAQEPDGYLTTCVTNKCTRLSGWWGSSRWEKLNSHELYNSGHLYEAAVAHYTATGKRTLLDVAIRNANLVCQVFGPNDRQKHVPSGHPIIEMALAKLYKVTGNEQYLQTAKYFIDETGRGTDGHRLSEYSQDHMPILQQDEIVGHAVRAGYLYSGVADIVRLTCDSAYMEALCRIWKNLTSCKLYITGGMGSRVQGEGFGPNYELNNHTAYCETCASIANVYWNYRMFLATGEAKYADVYERALYNGVLSGVSLSGDKFFYDNPLESMGQHRRERWFGCACCPGNITRFMASVPQYIYATQANDIYVNMYVSSKAHINDIEIVQRTAYPWCGRIELTLNTTTDKHFALRLRIPGWAQNSPVPSNLYSYVQDAQNVKLFVNNHRTDLNIVDGYATIERNWSNGDNVRLELPMEVKQVKANINVADDQGKLAVERGPIVYCLEGADLADSCVFNKIISPEATFSAQYRSTFLTGAVVLTTTGQRLEQDNNLTPLQLTLIPYSMWNNRGANQMAVWIPIDAWHAHITPQPTIASCAHSLIKRGAIQKDAPEAMIEDWAWGVNDQWEPQSSSDISKPYHYWWLKYGSLESISYKFDKPTEVSNVSVYWLDFDHYDGNFRVPESWKLYYEANGKWSEVPEHSEYGIEKDKYNTVLFKPIVATGLRIEAQLQANQSGGIIEWKVGN